MIEVNSLFFEKSIIHGQNQRFESGPFYALSLRKYQGAHLRNFKSSVVSFSSDFSQPEIESVILLMGEQLSHLNQPMDISFFKEARMGQSWLSQVKGLLTEDSQLALMSKSQLEEIKKLAPHLLKKMTLIAKLTSSEL